MPENQTTDVVQKALESSDALIVKAQGILETYLHPDSGQDADQTVSALLYLLDGPEQREVQSQTRAALVGVREPDQ